MRRLAPDFFDRRFDNLVEAGRSRLPSLAPGWTDYNAHDPGITLMELLAWNTEAQLYSLARMRRDERTGYAALLGLHPEGPTPAHGTLWADLADGDSPMRTFRQSLVIDSDAAIRTLESDTPEFHTTHRILWTPGRVLSLKTRLADGTFIDHTRGNERADRPFEPFGSQAGPRDQLRLEFATNGDRGLFPAQRELDADAWWPLGVRVAPPLLRAINSEATGGRKPTPLNVEMIVGSERVPLRIVSDGTRGFLDSGVLLLDLSAVPDSPRRFVLEISGPRGFARPPRVLRIDPGALPIVQGGTVLGEEHPKAGESLQRISLEQHGLRFGAGVPPVKVAVIEDGLKREWQRVDDLVHSGPDDRVYELDTAGESIVLGNGVNGHLPAAQSKVLIDYPYCDGAAANLPRNQRWSVRGIAGVFGTNPDPVGGGRAALRDADLRREARRRLGAAHALVTANDIVAAALALPDLEVARASIAAPTTHPDALREVVLIALRARTSLDEPGEAPETPRWLAAVRLALLPRIPLGTRLTVRAPRYRTFSLRLRFETQPRRDPGEVANAVRQKLREAFVLVARPPLEARKFGTPVSRRDLAALIRGVAGVRRITELTVWVDGQSREELALKDVELPRLDIDATQIEPTRQSGGSGA